VCSARAQLLTDFALPTDLNRPIKTHLETIMASVELVLLSLVATRTNNLCSM